MKCRKIWKQLTAVALSTSLALPVPMVLAEAEEGQVTNGTEEADYSGNEERAADEFEIDEEGILIEYTGKSTEVVIPDTVSKIGAGAFSDYNNLKSVSIPNSVTSIGRYTFSSF